MTRKKQKIYCKYCKYFVKALNRKLEISGSKNLQFRKCKVKKDYVIETKEACESFTLSDSIFCPKYEYWVTPEICLARVKKKICSKSCKIYKLIKELKDV